MFNHFREEGDKFYDNFRITLSAILLGKGDNAEKADILFDHFDKDKGGSLSAQEIIDMINEISYITNNCFPYCALGRT